MVLRISGWIVECDHCGGILISQERPERAKGNPGEHHWRVEKGWLHLMCGGKFRTMADAEGCSIPHVPARTLIRIEVVGEGL